jgi:hypothetical protein
MKDFEEYKRKNTAVDWIIRDMMIEINKLRKRVVYLYVIVIAAIALTAIHVTFSEPDEDQQGFLEGVTGVSNVTWGNNDTNTKYPDDYYNGHGDGYPKLKDKKD